MGKSRNLPATGKPEDLPKAAIIFVVKPPLPVLQSVGIGAFQGRQAVGPIITVRALGYPVHEGDFHIKSPIRPKNYARTVGNPATLIRFPYSGYMA
jgi:hypothetical protein